MALCFTLWPYVSLYGLMFHFMVLHGRILYFLVVIDHNSFGLVRLTCCLSNDSPVFLGQGLIEKSRKEILYLNLLVKLLKEEKITHQFVIAHPTECFVKLNIGGAVSLLDKILLKKRLLDFSLSWYK